MKTIEKPLFVRQGITMNGFAVNYMMVSVKYRSGERNTLMMTILRCSHVTNLPLIEIWIGIGIEIFNFGNKNIFHAASTFLFNSYQ